MTNARTPVAHHDHRESSVSPTDGDAVGVLIRLSEANDGGDREAYYRISGEAVEMGRRLSCRLLEKL